MRAARLAGLVAGGTVAAATLWRYNRSRIQRAERRHPPIGRFLHVDGTRLHLTIDGQGPPVLLLHGAAGTLRDFDALRPLLSRQFTVVALDRPGHGYSAPRTSPGPSAEAQVPLLRSLLHQLDLERPIVLGYSWSAALALCYGLRHPDETTALVLVGGTTHDGDEPDNPLYWMLRTPAVSDALLALGLIPIGRTYIGRPLRRAFAPERPPAEYMDVARHLWVRPGPVRAMTRDFRTLGRTLARIRPRYPELRVPTVAVSGDRDLLVDHDRNSVRFTREAPHSELITVMGAGHALPQLRPGVVTHAVERALHLGTKEGRQDPAGS